MFHNDIIYVLQNANGKTTCDIENLSDGPGIGDPCTNTSEGSTCSNGANCVDGFCACPSDQVEVNGVCCK